MDDLPVREVHVVLFARCRSLALELGAEEPTDAEAPPKYTSASHLVWMCDEAVKSAEAWPLDKLARWLGFVQGVLAARGKLHVDHERAFSRPLFQAAWLSAGLPLPASAGPERYIESSKHDLSEPRI